MLACPDCGSDLANSAFGSACSDCAYRVGRRGDVPVLLPSTQSFEFKLQTPDGSAMERGYRQPSRLLLRLRRLITSEYFPGRAWRRHRAALISESRDLLVIGSGTTRYANGVHLDIDDFPGVDIVADAQKLPFRDRSFDGVLCEVVLEHVAHPQRVIEECLRVLRPGGHCFWIVPFLFPYHGHPADYRRWSKDGLTEAFSRFDEVDIGLHGGPCSAMVNLLTEWVYVFSGLTFPRGYLVIKGAATALLFPLKFLDKVVNRFPEAHRLASTFYVAARKPFSS